MMALELEDRARARGAQIYATIEGYASTCDAYHRVQMDPDGEQIVQLHARRDRQVRPRAGRDRLHQLSRHLDAAERRDRIALHARGVRRARGAHSGIVDQVDDRPSAGRQRIGRRGRDRAGAVARLPAADDQPDRVPIRIAISISSRTKAATASPVAALCNCLGFGSKNSALVLGRADSPQRANSARRGPRNG